MRYDVFVVEDGDEFFVGHDRHVATFENVDEDFMDEVTRFISTIRDVKARYEDAPQDKRSAGLHPTTGQGMPAGEVK